MELSNLSWEADIVLNERMSRIRAWRVATAAIVMAFLLAIVIAFLIPLKQVVPYVITVDKLTGESSIAVSAKDYLSSSSLNDKHWLKTFLIARERYVEKMLQHDYDTIKILAADKPWQTFSKLYEGDDRRDTKWGDSMEILPTILSISISDGGIATIRYELRTKDFKKGGEPVITRHVATIRYSYKPNKAKTEFELIDNPLGFMVDEYLTDPEFITPTGDLGAKK